MTLLGKSFSVIILILSLTFMVLALAVNASHRNWRDVVMGPGGYKEKIQSLESSSQQLRDQKQKAEAGLSREQAARRTALAALQTQLDQQEDQLQNSEATVQKLEGQNTELSQTDRSRAQYLEELTAETKRLREQIRSEQEDRDQLFTQTLQLTDQMNKLRGIVSIQQDRNDQLMAQVTRYKEVIDARGIDINDSLDGAPPERNGTVLVINRPKKLVEISIGYDDGLRKGHKLEVTRGGRYVGKLQVLQVEPDHAVASILPDYSQGIIQENDRVDTTLD
ncbi:Chromosome partition protein Smc [Planctomycetes bacterium CA13]|uniref:Chromosome partition protein Smc n=1 Tax=Novipirellula herctigrandis TaxID=2527986 RepID=A0A5C5Z9J7_9BACT|nr:Chromosome partition protein Smc [Planctomycetes bacterium CA13]